MVEVSSIASCRNEAVWKLRCDGFRRRSHGGRNFMPNNILLSPNYRALPLIQVDDLRFFVLDEADRMVEKGHFKELQSIIDTLPKQGGSAPAESDPPEEDDDDDMVVEAPVAKHAAQRQTFVFSATLMVPPSLKKKLKGAGKVPMRREQGQVAALIERAGA
jgi:superfamily II DNA/RNA helicase